MSDTIDRRKKMPAGHMGRFHGGRRIGREEKAKDLKRTLARLMAYNKNYVPALLLVLFLAALATIFEIIGPNQLKIMVDEIAKGLPDLAKDRQVVGAISFERVTGTGIMLVSLYGFSGLLTFLENYIMATITSKIAKKMRGEISEKINRLPLSYFDGRSYGDVLSLISNDVDTIGHTLNQSLDNLVKSVVTLVGTLIMMIYNSWILTLVAVGSVAIGFLFMQFIMGQSQKYFTGQQAGIGDINGHIEEVYAGHNIVKAYNGGKEARETFEKINTGLYESAWKSQFISGLMMPLMDLSGNLGYLAVCVVGAILTMKGRISFGVIVAFMLYVRYFTRPLSHMGQSMQGIQRTAAASERVFEFYDQKELDDESHKTKKLDRVKGDVEFKNVCFGYDKDKIVIDNFSAKIKAGQKVAIVGPTGAGKTTIVNLLMRFYEINDGQILIDGIPIDQVTRHQVHDQFCMVLQDTWTFKGTIKENIVYNQKNVTDATVEEACKAVGLDHLIRTLPKGYQTILDDRTILSEGQKQLLTIARAVIQNAPMLILDEATSSVDTRTERHVQVAMDKLTEGRTSFVIAHRLSTIKNSDLILVMEGGNIVESGNHQTLLEKNGPYAAMYRSQWA